MQLVGFDRRQQHATVGDRGGGVGPSLAGGRILLPNVGRRPHAGPRIVGGGPGEALAVPAGQADQSEPERCNAPQRRDELAQPPAVGRLAAAALGADDVGVVVRGVAGRTGIGPTAAYPAGIDRTRREVGIVLAAVLILTGCPKQVAVEQLPPPDPKPASEQSVAPDSDQAAGRVLTAVPCGVAGPFGDICEIMKTTDPGIDMQADVANTMVLNRKLIDGRGSCDAYLAMGNVEVEALRKVGKVARAVPVAGMGLGLIVAKGNPLGIKSITDLAHDNVKAVAIARPNSSVGFCAEQALRNAGVWAAVEDDSSRYAFVGQAETAERGLCFVIRWRGDIQPGMWVLWRGEKQTITKLGEYDFKRRYLKLSTVAAKEVGG